ncbi:MAG: TIM barrel protein [Verrucomicrobiota bacterium]
MNSYPQSSRRSFIKSSALTALGLSAIAPALHAAAKGQTKVGLVTYQWGKDWDLPTLIKNCETAGLLGVEPRTTHSHAIEIPLNKTQRAEVKKRFADSPVTCVGLGSDERFDNPDPATLEKAVAQTKAFLDLSRDIGASGVKVKPNSFHKDVDKEKTLEQIGKTFREVAQYGADIGQEVRMEVHGQCAAPAIMAQIVQIADHPNAKICWNCNPQDMEGDGFDHNLKLLRKAFGATCHIHELDGTYKEYPYDKLFKNFASTGYNGWCLFETSTKPADRIKAMTKNRQLFDKMIAS